jgi:hypothetical protein
MSISVLGNCSLSLPRNGFQRAKAQILSFVNLALKGEVNVLTYAGLSPFVQWQ